MHVAGRGRGRRGRLTSALVAEVEGAALIGTAGDIAHVDAVRREGSSPRSVEANRTAKEEKRATERKNGWSTYLMDP